MAVKELQKDERKRREDGSIDEVAEVFEWRRSVFKKLAPRLSNKSLDELAKSSVDTHKFKELLERGCKPSLAKKILA